jgi:serine/threonine protein kinase/tetratricopeptide (TPR) repeat protein
MNPDAWARAEALFNRVADLPPNERAALLNACGDPDLRREVESLLANADGDGEPPTLTAVAGLAADFADESDPDRLRIGQHLGPYRIDSIAGHGGMGAVFAATRDDDQYHQRVAIKLVRAAVASPDLLARFRRERQILARLEHNYIARLLDGGVTEDALPYLVMEYVDGQAITTYCERHKLNLTERIVLFRKVCEAVEYAHRNLVVHRDLKPANILVTADGTPKLLDFGIARLVDPPSDEPGALPQTMTMAVHMTPAYASPEQVRGEPVSTASDVYSLGTVLYELLTGSKAHRFTGGTPAELIQVVCNTEVTRPSAVISTGDRDHRKLKGDLDNIILKAMRKDPARRYGSVAEFSLDLGRYLEQRPVLARPDTLMYRTGKFVRRNWVALLAASIALAGVCAGSAVAVYQARIAKERFQQVRKLANRFLFDFYAQIATVPGTTKAKEMVVSTALEYLDQLSRSAGNDVDLQFELADAYEKVGTVVGYPGEPGNLGRIRDAAAAYRKAIAIYEHIGESSDRARYNTARCSVRLSHLLQRMGSVKEAGDFEAKACPIIDDLLRKEPNNVDYLTVGALYAKLRAMRQRDESNAQAAVDAALQGREYRRRILQAHNTPKAKFELAIQDLEVGDSLMLVGELERARGDVAEARRLLTEVLASDPRQTAYRRSLFLAYEVESAILDDDESPNMGNTAEAFLWAQKGLALTEDAVKADAHDAQAKSDLSWALDRVRYTQRHEPEKALEVSIRAVGLQDQLAPLGYPPARRANIVRGLAMALLGAGKPAEALQHATEAVSIHQAAFAKDPNNRETLLYSLCVAGDALLADGKTAEAGEKYREAVKLAEPLLMMPTSPARLLNAERALLRYADYCRKSGRGGEAQQLYGRILQGWSGWDKPNPYTERKRAEALSRTASTAGP